ncbi:radical SAM family heme chaperone HemW [Yoonia sediminilitoris]|uniref:Heme chaperone HemW n=1 Tax=Yoonia sediminilitoris TaxID=1286148 RepID=A0A2T6KLU9_9RHOB|nr:radical SAM family heme chaperone HemW [Yoonia sediminilitoris]PUB17173.1 oxygen-independent coproporphyrinogen-3 oxidase [Yoonia sediminilitoris]RCW97468.1 oxygen-independent coproporphyrinogen-3 oxidase [Yoonia sediminilitoris]
MAEDWEHGGFGLYIHWPFCQAKCPYCDFNSHVVASIDQTAWADAYLSEIDRIGALTQDRVLRSVFFGGGTPSLMDPDVVDAVLTRVRATWPMANDIEITLEANPTSVEAGRFAGYRQAGVNRVSMGIQALNDPDLKALGRLHSTTEALKAFDIARTAFDRVSFDLIYARQRQSLAEWKSELTQALALAIDHLSLYQLTIEDGTAFGDRYAAGRLADLPDDDLAADMFEMTQDICGSAGFAGYEISNHAPAGSESIHNQIYWRYGDYAGIGPGAHGRLTLNGQRYATAAPLAPGQWLKQVRTTANGDGSCDILDLESQQTEFLLMGLRLTEGVSLARLGLHNNADLLRKINMLSDSGFVEVNEDLLKTTRKGRPVLNAVLRELLDA